MKLKKRIRSGHKFARGDPVHYLGIWRKVLEYWWDFKERQWVCIISSDGGDDCLAPFEYELWRVQEVVRPPKPTVRH